MEEYSKVLIQEKKKKKIIFNFNLEYFNSSSAKALFDFFIKLDTFYKSGTNMLINWYYEVEDIDVQIVGKDFSEAVSIPFNNIPL